MTFENILQMRQKDLKRELDRLLRKQGYEVVNKHGFLYAKGTVPVLLVAHLDTVHREAPRILCYSSDKRYMTSPQGIGGDDRAGVYMILQIIQSQRCHVLFCEETTTLFFTNVIIRNSQNLSAPLDSPKKPAPSAIFP